MKRLTEVQMILLSVAFSFGLMACSPTGDSSRTSEVTEEDLEKSVAEYTKRFPYQDTYNYAMKYTGGEPAKFNTWVLGAEPALVKAGEDKVVRMNNDTYYKMAFLLLDQGPVVLESANPSKERFSSFQLMDDHNVNFQNLIHPSGKYTLYHGETPDSAEGEAVETPSSLAVVIVRVEVKDKGDVQFDDKGEEMIGSNGAYTIDTEEPPVDAFWSITAYDTGRGGFLHPNDDDRYHVNNASAVKNSDGTFNFTFKQKCEEADLNCLEVPAGRFDYVVRYYLPEEPIRDGSWRMSKAVLQEE